LIKANQIILPRIGTIKPVQPLAGLKIFVRRGIRGLRAAPARIARKCQNPAFSGV